jgi:hypothetical protein
MIKNHIAPAEAHKYLWLLARSGHIRKNENLLTKIVAAKVRTTIMQFFNAGSNRRARFLIFRCAALKLAVIFHRVIDAAAKKKWKKVVFHSRIAKSYSMPSWMQKSPLKRAFISSRLNIYCLP